MKFRSVILIAVMVLVAGLVTVSILSVSAVVQRAARAQLAEALTRSSDVFRDLQGYRGSLFDAEARMTAQEPRVKAVVAAEDVSRATVLDVAEELRTTLGSDLLLFTDGKGKLLADTADPEASGFDMSGLEAVRSALESGKGSGIWTSEDGITQVNARPLTFGNQAVGVLVVGHKLDARVLETVYRQTGSGAVVLFNGQVAANSAFPGVDAVDPAEVSGALAELEPETTHDVTIGGHHYVAEVHAMPGYTGKHRLDFAVVRSLDEALATSREATERLYTIAGVALLLAGFVSVVVSSRLARPIDSLVGFTKDIGDGVLEPRKDLGGPVELRTLGSAMNTMVAELAESREQMAAKERLERDMEIAERIQTTILPKNLEVDGLEIAARMVAADEVGGDYYDVLPASDGAWIGIGDVAGHGLPAGLVMLMVQSATGVLTQTATDKPSDLVTKLNRTLHDNVRNRLVGDEHVTFTLLRYWSDGRFVHAGAHEDIIVSRPDAWEAIRTPGTWLAARADITRATQDHELRLNEGDVMVLYTDGIIEAMDESGAMFDIGRLGELVHELRGEPVQTIVDRIFEATDTWSPEYDDDRTVVVIRRSTAASS